MNKDKTVTESQLFGYLGGRYSKNKGCRESTGEWVSCAIYCDWRGVMVEDEKGDMGMKVGTRERGRAQGLVKGQG